MIIFGKNMKIPASDIEYIQNVIKTVQAVGIEKVAIEPGIVRGIDDDKTVFILQTENVPSMQFGSIGLVRLSVFQNRLNIVQEQPNFSVETNKVVETAEGSYIQSVTLKSSNLKIDYTCANPKIMLGVRKINDSMKAEIDLTPEVIKTIQRGVAAMSGEIITIINNNTETFIEILDKNKDVFKYALPHRAVSLNETLDPTFAFRYPADIVLSLFKLNQNGSFRIGNKGILNISVNNLNMYVMPRV